MSLSPGSPWASTGFAILNGGQPIAEKDQSPTSKLQNPVEAKRTLLDPFGRHIIALGDGYSLRLFRSARWHQARIEFYAPENTDPTPAGKYMIWLRQRGWKWHAQGLAWDKQLASNTEETPPARAKSDLDAHKEFIELANLIRQDKGLEPVAQFAEPQRGART